MRTPRQRDRRGALTDLLATLTQPDQPDISLMRGAFEQALRRIVPVRTVRLREAASRWAPRADGAVGGESVAFDVPRMGHRAPAVLEATFDPACRLGPWDFQMLGVAAQVAALLLEIEHGRIQAARNSVMCRSLPMRGLAGSLIGATPAMEALRASIQRVAATDFVVLLEGGSGSELGSRFRP